MFRTKIKIDDAPFSIDYHSKILLSGSCFSEHIGNQLSKRKFDVLANPFGIVYNAFTLKKQIERSISNVAIKSTELVYNENSGLYAHYDYHSLFANPDKEVVIENINDVITKTNHFLEEASIAIFTLGTSFVYQQNSDKTIVGNCHKLSSSLFNKQILSIEEQYKQLSQMVELLTLKNKNIQILLTVSPVRHIKEGLSHNNLSKSILKITCQKLVDKYSHVHYFPSYEIMMDDLRDYRFYDADMIHPNQQAIRYIWEHFCNTYFNENTFNLMQKIEKLILNKKHKYFNPDAPGSIAHLNKTKKDEIDLLERYVFLKDRFQ